MARWNWIALLPLLALGCADPNADALAGDKRMECRAGKTSVRLEPGWSCTPGRESGGLMVSLATPQGSCKLTIEPSYQVTKAPKQGWERWAVEEGSAHPERYTSPPIFGHLALGQLEMYFVEGPAKGGLKRRDGVLVLDKRAAQFSEEHPASSKAAEGEVVTVLRSLKLW